MSLKKISRIAVLSALAIVLRYAFGAFPNVKPITAIFLVATIFYGLWEGMLIMMVTMLVTSFVLGFGPWVFGQLLAYSLILFLWKCLCYPLLKIFEDGKVSQMIFQSVLAGVMAMLYGLIIDSYSALIFGSAIWPMLISGFYFNVAHALSTIAFYPFIFSIFRRFATNEKSH